MTLRGAGGAVIGFIVKMAVLAPMPRVKESGNDAEVRLVSEASSYPPLFL